MSAGDHPFEMLVTDVVADPGHRRSAALVGRLEIDLPSVATTETSATVDVELLGTVDGLLATGSVTATVEFRCNRCLTEWSDVREATFSQVYGAVDLEAIEDDELEASAVEPLPDDGTIDLETVVRDEFSLSLPLVPVCREDCKGLCPTCGTDLNGEPCSGHPDDTDSPFAALEGLFGPDTGSGGRE